MVRTGSSLRTQSRIAVDAVTGSSSRISPTAGSTGSDRIGGTAHDDEADQGIAEAGDHPGQRERKQDERDDIEEPEPSGRQCQRGKTKDPAMVTINRTAKAARLANMNFPAASDSFIFGAGRGWRDRLRLLIQHRLVQITYNTTGHR